MKKIRSKIDVITNSSTEVFTCKTDKSLEEVSDFLKKVTRGYEEPEIMDKKSEGPLKELIDFGYLVDPEDPESVTRFQLKAIQDTEWMDEHYVSHPIPGALELKTAFGEFLWTHKEELRKYCMETYGPDHWRNRDGGFLADEDESERVKDHETFMRNYMRDFFWSVTDPGNYPEGYIQKFLDSYPGTLPTTLTLSDDMNADLYVGQIGFCGKEDNSIPYETWDVINDYLNATNWHLG